MKLCFSTLGCTDRSLYDILELAAAYHIQALEIRGIGNVMDNRKIDVLSEEYTEKTQRAFEDARVKPQVLGTSCIFHDPNKIEEAIAEGLASIEIASRLHIPYIRVFGNKLIGQTEDEQRACMSRVADGISRLCDVGAEQGITVLLEVHGDYNRIETLMPIVKALETKTHFGLIWDIAHTRAYGENWSTFYQAFCPYIRHVHIKDCRMSDSTLTLPGEGDLPIVPIMKMLLQDGFDGCFSLEWEKKWHPELPDMESALASFVALTAKITI